MKKKTIVSVCNNTVNRNKPEMTGWGFNFLVDDELEALRIAYAYRNAKHGVKIENCQDDKFLVTIFDENGAAMKLDGSK